jgi:signal transduction histidine kinase
MSLVNRPDAFEPRTVFRVYAWVAIGAGIMLYGTIFPFWLSSYDLPVVPWGRISLGRVAGAIAVVFGWWASTLARRDDEFSSRDLARFATAHLVFGGLIFIQWFAIWDHVLPGTFAWTPMVAGLVLLAIAADIERQHSGWSLRWMIAELFRAAPREPTPVMRERSGPSLRGRYEEQIRQAARQEERARLARELHDAVKQQLFAIQTAAATAETRFHDDPSGAQAALAQVRGSAREALTEMEVMLDQLQAAPLTTAGLVEALRRAGDALAFRTGAHVTFETGDLPRDVSFRPGAHQAMLRFAQEALANVARHARATTVTIHFGLDQGWTPPGSDRQRVLLAIADNGHGFHASTTAPGMGLKNMAARAAEAGGTMELDSGPGATSVRLAIENEIPSPRRYVRYAIASFASALVLPVMMFAHALSARPHVELYWIAAAVLALINGVRYSIAAYRVRAWQ